MTIYSYFLFSSILLSSISLTISFKELIFIDYLLRYTNFYMFNIINLKIFNIRCNIPKKISLSNNIMCINKIVPLKIIIIHPINILSYSSYSGGSSISKKTLICTPIKHISLRPFLMFSHLYS
jgi:hypothetical protein